jgi:hypothetical protein
MRQKLYGRRFIYRPGSYGHRYYVKAIQDGSQGYEKEQVQIQVPHAGGLNVRSSDLVLGLPEVQS